MSEETEVCVGGGGGVLKLCLTPKHQPPAPQIISEPVSVQDTSAEATSIVEQRQRRSGLWHRDITDLTGRTHSSGSKWTVAARR